MGASSSFPTNINLDIYLSYPAKNEYIDRMKTTLQNTNFTIVESSLIMMQPKSDISFSEISKYMEMFMDKTKYIFVCISSKTIKSVTQTLEMNEIIDKYPTIQQKIIYLILEEGSEEDSDMKSIIKKNLWYPLYDEDSLFHTTNKLLTLLLKDDQYH